MKQFACATLLIFSSTLCTPAQEAGKPTPEEVLGAQAKNRKEPGVTYGRIKEVFRGQKIVIEVDGAPDKIYNLADAKRTITVAEDLAIGDKVKVHETDKKGVKSVQIVRDVTQGKTGDQKRTRKQ